MERQQAGPRNRQRKAFTVLGVGMAIVAAFGLGRATAREGGLQPTVLSLPTLLARHPMAKDEAFKIIPAVQGQDASVTVVRALGDLPPHYHEAREEIVYVVRGGGTMTLGGEKRPVKAGDILHIPRKTVHGFTNGARRETVVVSVMAPPFDGKDRIFLNPPVNEKK